MKTQELIDRLKLIHKRETSTRNRGGWGVPEPLQFENSIYGLTCNRLNELEQETLKLLRVIEDIKADLLMRADIDSEGLEAVNLSDHIWHSIKTVTEDS